MPVICFVIPHREPSGIHVHVSDTVSPHLFFSNTCNWLWISKRNNKEGINPPSHYLWRIPAWRCSSMIWRTTHWSRWPSSHSCRLRYRLLTNLPVLDLCQLEHTSVALGVDLESIWKLKLPPWNDVQVESKLTTDNLKRTLLSDPSSWPWRDQYLHVVATAVLCNNLSQYRRTPKQGVANVLPKQGVANVLPLLVLSPRDKYFCSLNSVVLDWLISIKGY